MGSLNKTSVKNKFTVDVKQLKRRERKTLKKKALPFLICLIMSMLTMSSTFANSACSQTETTLTVEPQNIVDPTLVPNATFQINITVTNVVELYGWEFKLYYLKSVLTLTSVRFGPFLETGGTTFTIDKSNQNYNTTHGVVWLADSLLAAPGGVNGSGTLASVKFTVNQIGSTNLSLADTKMGNKSGEAIPHQTIDGYFSNVVSKAVISVKPEKIIDSSIKPCNNFTINITITEAVNVNSWEIKLFYNNSVLNVSSVEFGLFLQSGGATNQNIKQLTDNYNATHGIVWLNEALLSPIGVSGDGILASITFHVEAVGESYLTLEESVLSDPSGHTLNHTSVGGYFNNMLMAKIFIDPEEIFDPTLTPGSIVNVTVKITEVTDLYEFQFNLTYEKDILNCLGVLIIPYNNECNFNSQVRWDDNTGEIFVKVSYQSPAEPITSFTPFEAAKIFFQVSEMGVSPLHFHNTLMKNIEGSEIQHETRDGLIYIAIRDVAVINLTADKTNVYPGELINITLTVENRGNLTESFTVMLTYDDNNIANLTILNLPPQTQQTINYIWNTTGFPPCYNKTLNAYAVPVPYERNLKDNFFTDGILNITLIGDVNGDGIVDIYDITLAGNAFGFYVGEPKYNERADINHDGEIDIYDLILISVHFGESY